jgi:hypothetical protein
LVVVAWGLPALALVTTVDQLPRTWVMGLVVTWDLPALAPVTTVNQLPRQA